jgi:hypothetical protein
MNDRELKAAEASIDDLLHRTKHLVTMCSLAEQLHGINGFSKDPASPNHPCNALNAEGPCDSLISWPDSPSNTTIMLEVALACGLFHEHEGRLHTTLLGQCGTGTCFVLDQTYDVSRPALEASRATYMAMRGLMRHR